MSTIWRVSKTAVFVLLVASVLSLSFLAGYGVGQQGVAAASGVLTVPRTNREATAAGRPSQFKLLGEIWDVLQRDFVDRDALEPEKLGRGAIAGLLEALNDPHTSYLSADQYQMEQSSYRGSYQGIGAQVALVEGQITVVAPFAGSPAEVAGLRPGDRIVEVNGESTAKMTLNEAVEKIKGPPGTKVILLVLHEGQQDPVRLTVERAEIQTGSVFLRMLPEGYAHVRITHFSQRTPSELRSSLKQIQEQGAKGIVLDLRNNPGGLLDASVEVASQFLETGSVVAYQVHRDGAREKLEARSSDGPKDIPLVVLVNQGSASGSEVVSGALQDAGRGRLIGTKTFGKGSVNNLRELSDGSALYVSIARWLTPKGTLIEGNGIAPDIAVELSSEDIAARNDRQLARAVEELDRHLAAN